MNTDCKPRVYWVDSIQYQLRVIDSTHVSIVPVQAQSPGIPYHIEQLSGIHREQADAAIAQELKTTCQ